MRMPPQARDVSTQTVMLKREKKENNKPKTMYNPTTTQQYQPSLINHVSLFSFYKKINKSIEKIFFTLYL